MIYLTNWPNISQQDKDLIEQYIDNTDAIVTINDAGQYQISTPEETITYTTSNALMKDITYNLNCLAELGIIQKGQ